MNEWMKLVYDKAKEMLAGTITPHDLTLLVDVFEELESPTLPPPPDGSGGTTPDPDGPETPPTFEEMFVDYPDPLYADRHSGGRRLVFLDHYKIHYVKTKANGEPKTHLNDQGVEEYVVAQSGTDEAPAKIFDAGDAVWVWYKSIPTNILQRGWEVCDLPGYVVLRNNIKVQWQADQIRTELP